MVTTWYIVESAQFNTMSQFIRKGHPTIPCRLVSNYQKLPERLLPQLPATKLLQIISTNEEP